MRIYYTLRYLAERHQVTLLAFCRAEDRPEAIEHLRSFCSEVYTVPVQRGRWRDGWHLARSLFSQRSFIIERDRNLEMNEMVDRLIANGRYDVVHADQIYMVQYALRARQTNAVGSKFRLVVDKHNADYQIVQRLAMGEPNFFKRQLYEREWRALRRFEGHSMLDFDQVVTVTEPDRWILEALAETAQRESGPDNKLPKFSTIPICVDTKEVQPVNPGTGANEILYLGGLHWPPNVEGVMWFGREVWPKVKAQVPGARLTIVGKNPPGEVKGLEADPAVRVTGYVADPGPHLEQAGAFIVPLFAGSGMRVKIVDGWRWGLPVISTTIGAEGIEYREGENILIADDPEAFAAGVYGMG